MGCGELGGKSYGCMNHRDLGGPESIQSMLKDGINPNAAEEVLRVGMEIDVDFLAGIIAFPTGRAPTGRDVMRATLLVEQRYRSIREDPRIVAAESRFVAKDRAKRMEGTEATAPAKDGLKKK